MAWPDSTRRNRLKDRSALSTSPRLIYQRGVSGMRNAKTKRQVIGATKHNARWRHSQYALSSVRKTYP